MQTYSRYMSRFTGRDYETVRKDMSRNRYFTAQQAVDYGLVDRVLAPDDKQTLELQVRAASRSWGSWCLVQWLLQNPSNPILAVAFNPLHVEEDSSMAAPAALGQLPAALVPRGCVLPELISAQEAHGWAIVLLPSPGAQATASSM